MPAFILYTSILLRAYCMPALDWGSQCACDVHAAFRQAYDGEYDLPDSQCDADELHIIFDTPPEHLKKSDGLACDLPGDRWRGGQGDVAPCDVPPSSPSAAVLDTTEPLKWGPDNLHAPRKATVLYQASSPAAESRRGAAGSGQQHRLLRSPAASDGQTAAEMTKLRVALSAGRTEEAEAVKSRSLAEAAAKACATECERLRIDLKVAQHDNLKHASMTSDVQAQLESLREQLRQERHAKEQLEDERERSSREVQLPRLVHPVAGGRSTNISACWVPHLENRPKK
jgi:hypothetical protein